MTVRQDWEVARDLIERHTGPIRAATPVTEGLNSEIAVIVHTRHGSTFVKGLRADHPRVWTQEREKTINPYVRSISASLEWSTVTGGWNLLGFEHIDGRTAGYHPGSPDLDMIATALRELQDIDCPDIEMKHAEHRWAAYTDAPELFTGDHLLHTEFSTGNVLIAERAYLVDWAWPTRGAAWIDPACWAVWLIASGHTPEQAECWAARIPSWNTAPPTSLREFTRAQIAMWDGIAARDPEPWILRLAEAARRWEHHHRT